MSHRIIPVILAYGAHNSPSWLAPCPFCRRVHQHGAGEGTRLSHCPPDNALHSHEFEGRERPGCYELKYAGPITDEVLASFRALTNRPKPPKPTRASRSTGELRRPPATWPL